jgi:hypothetical protein
VTILGTPGADVIEATPGPDVIAGLGGADRIHGRGGNDLICGGKGADALIGDAGNDRLAGGPGSDRLFGGGGVDRCEGGGAWPPRCENPGALQAADVDVSTDESSGTTIDLVATAANPDGRHLVISALHTKTTQGVVSAGADGKTVRFEPAGRFTALDGSQSAMTSFGYTLSDLHGHHSSGVVTVTIHGIDSPPLPRSDEPPTAVADTARTTEGRPLTIDVLANDTDPDGGEKKIASVTQPEHGTVTVSESGALLGYAPDAGYCDDGEAADQFRYSLNGGSTATVQVRVACLTHLSITEGLFPSFDTETRDYVVHCDGSPLQVSGRTAADESLRVDGGPSQTGIVAPVNVPLEENQEFDFTLAGETSRDYHVRCLPQDFPTWEYQRYLQPHHAFYMVAPTSEIGGSAPIPPYVVLFDDHGVPVWWYKEVAGPLGPSVLADGDVAWWRNAYGGSPGAFVIRELDGNLVETVEAPEGRTDPHELQRLRNGNYLVIATHPREHVDLTAYGGTADETVTENDIEEVKPNGELAWKWSTEGHVQPEETGRWWPEIKATAERTGEWDEFHMNAIEPEYDAQGNVKAILFSLRQTDAIYKIDRGTDEIVWKLGGTPTPQSLTVLSDPAGSYPLGGQHDVRLLPDGTITLHDNDTNLGYPPRAVRYSIDEAARTATFVEEITDPGAPTSLCCGSARRSPDGSWLMSWGANSLVTEFDAAKQRTFQLGFGGAVFSYRATYAPDGVLSAETLRAGMNAMHPRP